MWVRITAKGSQSRGGTLVPTLKLSSSWRCGALRPQPALSNFTPARVREARPGKTHFHSRAPWTGAPEGLEWMVIQLKRNVTNESLFGVRGLVTALVDTHAPQRLQRFHRATPEKLVPLDRSATRALELTRLKKGCDPISRPSLAEAMAKTTTTPGHRIRDSGDEPPTREKRSQSPTPLRASQRLNASPGREPKG